MTRRLRCAVVFLVVVLTSVHVVVVEVVGTVHFSKSTAFILGLGLFVAFWKTNGWNTGRSGDV